MQPFDLQRIFFGDVPIGFILEIIFRTAILYLYTLGILRLIGQRGMEQLSSFDFAIVIAMGSAVGDPMFYPDVPLVHGMMVVTTILAIERGLGFIIKKSETAERVIEGTTRRVIQEGRIEEEFLKDSVHSMHEVMMKMREHGARHLGEVEAAYLELDGLYSVFLYPPEKSRPGLPLDPPWDIEPPKEYAVGAKAPHDGVFACKSCGKVETLSAGAAFPQCDRCEEHVWVEAAVSDPSARRDDNKGPEQSIRLG